MENISALSSPALKEWQHPILEELDLLDTAAKASWTFEENAYLGPQGS